MKFKCIDDFGNCVYQLGPWIYHCWSWIEFLRFDGDTFVVGDAGWQTIPASTLSMHYRCKNISFVEMVLLSNLTKDCWASEFYPELKAAIEAS